MDGLARADTPRQKSPLRYCRDYSGSRRPMKRTELVAVGIAEVSQIHLTAKSRRIFDRRATIRDTGFVPGSGLFWAGHRQTDRAAIGVSGWFAIDRLAHHQHAAVVHVAQSAPGILLTRLTADRCKQGVVNLFDRSMSLLATIT